MRGLTPAERAELVRYPEISTGVYEDIDDDVDQETINQLVKQGRMIEESECVDGQWCQVYSPTPLGRLALRLWPATAATPGAGGG